MGVKGLWKLMLPAATITCLPSMGLPQLESGDRKYRIGVDASIWIREVLHQRTKNLSVNSAIRCLFYKLCRLYKAGVHALFVFDGPLRPSMKRNTGVKVAEAPLIPLFCKMITAFGFEYHKAPAEAEAELAMLNRITLIDAVFSEDSDCFMFGAGVIVRGWSGKDCLNIKAPGSFTSDFEADKVAFNSKKYHLLQYRSDDIVQKVGLTSEDACLVALIAGGDYNPKGINNVGLSVAFSLARCGFGRKLAKLMDINGDISIDRLRQWKESLFVEAETNSQGMLSRKVPHLRSEAPESWPDKSLRMLYYRPLTSQSAGCLGYDFTATFDGRFCLQKVAEVMGKVSIVKTKFLKTIHNNLWEGMVVDMLSRSKMEFEDVVNETSISSSDCTGQDLDRVLQVIRSSTKKTKNRRHIDGGYVEQTKLRFTAADTDSQVIEWQSLGRKVSAGATISIWVPSTLLNFNTASCLSESAPTITRERLVDEGIGHVDGQMPLFKLNDSMAEVISISSDDDEFR